MTRSIPWPRILAEGFAIVVSILLAFGIQAWWEGRQERIEEQEALIGLEADFVASLGQLRVLILTHQEVQKLVAALEAWPDSLLAEIPGDSVGAYESALMTRATFDPRDGTLDGLIASGSLGIIREPLRNMLVSWSGLVEDAGEEAGDHRVAANGVRARIFEMGGPWRDLSPGVSRRTPSADLVDFAEDADLMALARGHLAASERYVVELRSLEELAAEVLRVIDSQLPRRAPVVSIAVSAAGPNMSDPTVGALGGLRAAATLSDGSTRSVTHRAQWTSSDTTVIRIAESVAQAHGTGQSEVCAMFEGVEGCLTLTVDP